jgi:hypothetical protein
MSSLPDAAKYDVLIEQLSEIERRTAAREIDALTASHDALCAVINFLHQDERVLEHEATRPLCRLMLAIGDRRQGAKPKLLGLVDRKGRRGPPTGRSVILLRARLNIVFRVLLDGGMPKKEAAQWLAAELKRSGVKQPNERAIDAREIIRWHAELGGKSMKGTDKFFLNGFMTLSGAVS